jgi:exodeoxyribonuclease-5
VTKSKIQLSTEQQEAYNKFNDWFTNSSDQNKVFTLTGLAGSGKSVLAAYIQTLNEDLPIAYCAYTGKAASVLKKKLTSFEVCPTYVGTIHGLIYIRMKDQKGNIKWFPRESLKDEFQLIIVDESSMVGEQIFRDLLDYDVPILFIGDNAQLPPVQDVPGTHFNNPDYSLTKIHRQAEGNPIIQFAHDIRNGKPITQYPGDKITFLHKHFKSDATKLDNHLKSYNIERDMVVCGFNKTRVKLNRQIRSYLGFTGESPVVGDKVICLKNNKEIGIFNGMIGIVKESTPNIWKPKVLIDVVIEFDDVTYAGPCLKNQFYSERTADETVAKGIKKEYVQMIARNENMITVEGEDGTTSQIHKQSFINNYGNNIKIELFDFSYANSVHKTQGSEFNKVIVIREEAPKLWEQKRWDYTAITRASEELVFVF